MLNESQIMFPPWYIPPDFSKRRNTQPYQRELLECHDIISNESSLQNVLYAFVKLTRNRDPSIRRWALTTFIGFFDPSIRWRMSQSTKLSWWGEHFTDDLRDEILHEIRQSPLDLNWAPLLLVRGALQDYSVIELMKHHSKRDDMVFGEWEMLIGGLRLLRARHALHEIKEAVTPRGCRMARLICALVSINETVGEDYLSRMECVGHENRLFAHVKCGHESYFQEAIVATNSECFNNCISVVLFYFYNEIPYSKYSISYIREWMNRFLISHK